MAQSDQSNDQPQEKQEKKIAGLLGIGLDGADGETLISRGKNFVLWGGSRETHSLMQETAIKVNEKLEQKGKRLDEVSVQELRDIVHDVTDSLGDKRHS